jgi:parallel beta-helix repeat protein
MSATPLRAVRVLVLGAAVVLGALLLVAPAGAKTSVDPACGATIYSSFKLQHSMYCSVEPALVVGSDDITIDLGTKSINGTFGCCDAVGIDVGDHTGVTVQNGTIAGFGYAVGMGSGGPPPFILGATHGVVNPIARATDVLRKANIPVGPSGDVVNNITIGSEQYVGYDNGGGFDSWKNLRGDTAGGPLLEDTFADVVSNVTLTGGSIGGESIEATGTQWSKIKLTGTTHSAAIGFLIIQSANESYSKIQISNAEWGFLQFNPGEIGVDPPGTNESFTNDKVQNAEFGFLLQPFDQGTVNVTGNSVTNTELGIYTLDADLLDCFCPSDPGSTISGNTVSKTEIGIWDFLEPFIVGPAPVKGGTPEHGSINTTWSNNTSQGNFGPGFYFLESANATITGNTAKNNLDSGFYLSDNDPSIGYNAAAFSNNRATGNGSEPEFTEVGDGFAADYPVSGVNNVAKKNLPYDCFNVSCSSTLVAPAGSAIHVNLAKVNSLLPSGNAASFLPAWAQPSVG